MQAPANSMCWYSSGRVLECSSARVLRGFTLVELLVSMGIFVIITSLVIVNFRSGQYRDELNGAAGIVQAALREAQTAASSGTVTPSPCPDPANPGHLLSTAGPPPSGYGLHLTSPNTIIEFADCETAAPKTYTYSEADQNFIFVRAVQVSPNVKFSNLQPGDPLDIVFDPFVETVTVNNSASNAVITIQHPKGGGTTLSVHLNAATGQVFIQ